MKSTTISYFLENPGSYLRTLGGIALIMGMTLSVAGAEMASEAMAAARLKLKAADFAGADKDADEAIRLADGNIAQKVDAMMFKAQVLEASKDLEGAKAELRKVLSEEKASGAQKLSAINKIASILRRGGKFDEAVKAYTDALASPEFQADKPALLVAFGRLYEDQKGFAKAGEIYRMIVDDAEIGKFHKLQAGTALSKILVNSGKFDEAHALAIKALSYADLKPNEKSLIMAGDAGVYAAQNRPEKAKEEYVKASEIEGLKPQEKKNILVQLARMYKAQGDLPGMKQAIASIIALDPASDLPLMRDCAVLAASKGMSEEEDEAWQAMLSLPNLPAKQFSEAAFKRIDLLAAARNAAGLKEFVSRISDGKSFSDEEKLRLSLVLIGLEAGKESSVSTKTLPKTALDAEQQANAYGEAGKVMMRLRNKETARFFGEKADAMFEKRPEVVYDCKFMEKAPFGVSGWASSAIVKDPARRETRFEKYKQAAAALLINDVNVTRAPVVEGAGEKANTSFYMAADARGWHVYIHYAEDQAELVTAGILPGGNLETYFVPGEGECYYQLMMDVPTGVVKMIPWCSPHRNYRKLDSYFVSEVAPVDGGFGVYMFFPWEAVYDKLPKEGDLWPFGIVNFGRKGGFTWGSGQVHELSRFGKTRFTGVDKAMPAIRRAIVMKASVKYKKSALAAKREWNDEVKGDRAFYESVLRPEIERLDELGKKVKPEMTKEDVDFLFTSSVPNWMEFDYLVSELRTEYLKNELFSR